MFLRKLKSDRGSMDTLIVTLLFVLMALGGAMWLNDEASESHEFIVDTGSAQTIDQETIDGVNEKSSKQIDKVLY